MNIEDVYKEITTARTPEAVIASSDAIEWFRIRFAAKPDPMRGLERTMNGIQFIVENYPRRYEFLSLWPTQKLPFVQQLQANGLIASVVNPGWLGAEYEGIIALYRNRNTEYY